jgi:arginyl-tRNA synthetase
LKNLVDTWLRQALARLPESMVPPSGRDVCIEARRPKDARRGDFASNVALRLAGAARRDARLALASAVHVVPQNGLRLLGVAAPGTV